MQALLEEHRLAARQRNARKKPARRKRSRASGGIDGGEEAETGEEGGEEESPRRVRTDPPDCLRRAGGPDVPA